MRYRARALRRELAFLLELRGLPWRVAAFHLRARRLAARIGDDFSLVSATRPRKLAAILRLARGQWSVVELGTATAWTAISLLLADPQRRVISYDPITRPARESYLALVGADVRARLTLIAAPGESGPQPGGPAADQPVGLLYIDSSHEREPTLRELAAWTAALRPGALVVFDDYDHPGYPGVREAVAQLGLAGHQAHGLFVHERGTGGQRAFRGAETPQR